MSILEQKDKLNRKISEDKKNLVRQKRVERELRKVQSGGRVSSFLKREAENNETLAASINLATAPDALSMGQAIIQYQGAVNRSKRDLFYREPLERNQTTNIPAQPQSGTYVLGSVNGIIQWIATQDC